MQLSATLPAHLRSRPRRLGRAVIDGVLPPRCLVCGVDGRRAGRAVRDMLERDDVLRAAVVRGVRLPFRASDGGGGGLRRLRRPEAAAGTGRARSCAMTSTAARLVLSLKHGDRTHLARSLGRWMRRAGGEILDGADLLVPVPLHWTRLFARRYNQAALLAHAIHAAGGPPVAPDWLVRRRRTPSQGRLGPLARARNVRGAFALRRGPQRSPASGSSSSTT